MMEDALGALEAWYEAQTDGDWEHEWGVRIGTLDNPGWSLDVDLKDTALDGVSFDPVVVHRNDADWLHCRVEDRQFQGSGGARNLRDLIATFLAWAEANSAGDDPGA